jgi:hypothetical protein
MPKPVIISLRTGKPYKRPPKLGTLVHYGVKPDKGRVKKITPSLKPQKYTKRDFNALTREIKRFGLDFTAYERLLPYHARDNKRKKIPLRSGPKGEKRGYRQATKLEFGRPGTSRWRPVEIRQGKYAAVIQNEFNTRGKEEYLRFQGAIQARAQRGNTIVFPPITLKGETIRETIDKIRLPFDTKWLKKNHVTDFTVSGAINLPDGAVIPYHVTIESRSDFATLTAGAIRIAMASNGYQFTANLHLEAMLEEMEDEIEADAAKLAGSDDWDGDPDDLEALSEGRREVMSKMMSPGNISVDSLERDARGATLTMSLVLQPGGRQR